MNIEEFRDFCLSLPATTESMPFGDDTLVLKVMNKMFALASLNSEPLRLNLKCDPERAIALREQYEFVSPGYHMNKQHWNSVKITGDIGGDQIRTWIKDSYDLIVAGLPKKMKDQL